MNDKNKFPCLIINDLIINLRINFFIFAYEECHATDV